MLNKLSYPILIILILTTLLVNACAPGEPSPATAPAAEPTSAVSEAPAPAEPTAAPTTDVPVLVEFGTPTPDARPAVSQPPADGSRPLADLAASERADRFSGPAETSVAPDTIYVATLVTSKGNIIAELYQDTPESLNNFVSLSKNGFYDGLTFHRVEPDFVIQGGDPAGDGSGGPGYTIPAEINHTHPRGALAWARIGDQVNPERRSSGSQFYITLNKTPFLDGAYTVFGYVTEGMDVADQIAMGDIIERIDIDTTDASLLPTPTPTPEPKAPTAETGRPLASVPVEEREGYYNTAPELLITLDKTYQATLTTAKGDIVIDLDQSKAPLAVNSFVLLANLGFYDGMPVAYVQPDNYAILGSPVGSPDSDAGYTLQTELEPEASQVFTGTVSMYPVPDQVTGKVMASSSQFFISVAEAPTADTPLSIIGQVSSGQDVVLSLETGDGVESITINEK